MKKFLLTLGLMSILGGLISTASASSTSCKDVEFSNGVTVCVNISDAGTDRRELTADVDGGSTSSLRCDIMTPDSVLTPISSCNGEFNYDEAKLGRIKLWIRYSEAAPSDREGKPSSSSVRTYPQWVYDFDNEERAEDDLSDDDDYSSSNGDLDNFSIDLSDNTPAEDDEVTMTIIARDEDDDTITDYEESDTEITVQYRTSSSSSWRTATSTYVSIDDTTPRFYDGEAETNITFKSEYEYKVTVTDDDENVDDYEIFDVGGTSSSSSYDTDNFYLTTDDSTPSTSQYVDLTVKARDGSSTDTSYRGTVQFEVYYKASGSSTWTKTTSSTYYTMASSTYEDDGYTFTSSNNGLKTFNNFIKFNRNNYSYKILVYDEDDDSVEGYTTFTVGTTSSSSYDTDNFYLTTDDSTPSTSQYVDLTVKARDGSSTDTSYRGTVQFEVYYKASGSSTWTKTTSSTYYTMASSTYEDDGYTFTSSNNGLKTFSNLIKFNRNNYSYKVVVYDEDDDSVEGYTTFTVGTTSSSSEDTDNFYLTTDDSTPSTSQYVDLTVKARDGSSTDTSYRGTVQFEVYYKASGSSTWTKTTSSTYYTMVSTYEDNGYTFTSSNNGLKTFSNLIKFNRNNYSYKVLVYDEDDDSVEGYTTFTVGTANSSSDVDGYSSSELNTVETLYEGRDNMINTLESDYTTLRNSTRRQTMSDDFKTAMEEIIDDDTNKTYDTYDEFMDGWLDWYRYTVSIR